MNSEQRPIRIGDAERTRTEQVLAEAYASGRLTHEEYSDRAARVLSARFAPDLEELVADVVAGHPSEALAGYAREASGRTPAQRSSSAGSPVSLSIMSGIVRAGDWTVAPTHVAIAFWGAVDIDLREARFASSEVTIYALAIMGGIRVIVPPDVRVRVQGLPVMGGFASSGPSINPDDLRADAPVVTVTGLALMGAVEVVRRDYDSVGGS